MVTRILKLLKEENLTASQFADLIDVQRSSMSHILSGRNNPSLDFVHKTLKAFPKVNTDWLMSGIGEMYKTNTPVQIKLEAPTGQNASKSAGLFDLFEPLDVENKDITPKSDAFIVEQDIPIDSKLVENEVQEENTIINLKSTNSDDKKEQIPPLESNIFNNLEGSGSKMDSPQNFKPIQETKKIEKIVIFYTDKSFAMYNPE